MQSGQRRGARRVGCPCRRSFSTSCRSSATAGFRPIWCFQARTAATCRGRSHSGDSSPAQSNALEFEVPLRRDGDRGGFVPVMIAGRHPRTPLCAIRANTTPRSRPRTISSAAIRPGDHRCVDVHRAGSIGPSPPVLSSSNNPARANSMPLTINTQTGNAIVIHMLTSLATSKATAAT